MPNATPLRLGDDARFIRRKRGLTAEYFYVGEPVAVKSPSDSSSRFVGVVLSFTGDVASNSGGIHIGIGNGFEVQVQYTNISNDVSKLIGNFYILDADVSVEIDSTRGSVSPIKNSDAVELIQRIEMRVASFLKRRNPDCIEFVFKKYRNQATNLLAADSLHLALFELGIQFTAEEITALFDTFDIDENGGLDLQEFTNISKYPSKVEQWTRSLPLSQLLAHCLSFKESDDPLREISRLSSDELSVSIIAYSGKLKQILADSLSELNKCFAETERMAASGADVASSKFQTFKMSAGSVEDFHLGLHGRVGESHAPTNDSYILIYSTVSPHPYACRRPAPRPVEGHVGGTLRQGGLRR
jgi:hypothetical protein